ncbi:MAG: Holliday junction DNA helicase RuvA [Desulfobacterales bacterium]|uniref:Holliday junction branch migration complex subunit RuvA n=1 Tax=Candidatus Desulfaltia bathyphila TaxID=2841697 RepID=A0A8J6TA14_9BACT|nr:Holliday junction DNA helicase RuvA [Candidatus Desulfaltia bathyphila]MBL7196010.1 Holliday junction DNA helicase RuvA [Desulfobacterales bacterium]MBL7207432.1 Holliday junction DNA helicase RuvA [Desulfobacterales bacterium]
MIGYIEGKLLKKEDERILLLAGQVGYEVLLPAFVMDSFKSKVIGDEVSLYIYYQQTERQPKPVLIGFNLEVEREFFQYFISVEDIGPLKAVKAMSLPVREIARAIESKDVAGLKRLKGIGNRTAQKIIATLEGKMNKFALIRKTEKEREETPVARDFSRQVFDVLVGQLGYRAGDAKRIISEAVKRNINISTPEELIEEVYRGEKTP